MSKLHRKLLASVLTTGCLVGGGLLLNVPVANAAALQKDCQQIIEFQTGLYDQGFFDTWLQLGLPNQQTGQQSGQQPGLRLGQQSGQQPGLRLGQQSGQLPGLRLGQQSDQQQSSFNILSKVASILGIDEQTIIDELQDGKTLVEIADNYGVEESELLSELTDLLSDAIDEAIDAGTITETQATEIESQLTERLTQLIEGTINNSNSSLSAPTDLDATVQSSSEIDLDWDSVDDATSYYIYRSTSYSGTYSKVATVTTTNYSDTDLSDDTTYYYTVKAVYSSGTSDYSSVASATTGESDELSAPTDLNATVQSSSEIDLDWDSVDDATSYYIYRSTSYSGTYSKVATVSDTDYTDTDLSADTTYYYKIKAVNSSETSAYSSIKHATTDEE